MNDSLSNATDTARIAAAVAPLQKEARVSAPQTSQLVAGNTVTLLAHDGDWWRVAGRDGYEGFMHRGYLEPASGDEDTWRVTTGATVRTVDGARRVLPFGARVPHDATIVSGRVFTAQESQREFPLDGAAIVGTATSFFESASYLWGGVTPWGTDCSGLVQAVFALHGRPLPRDAWQQAEIGSNTFVTSLDDPSARDAFAPGDLLFFSDRDDRHITHVGLADDALRMVHSSLTRGGVCVEALDADNEYATRLRRNFVQARRVL